MRLKLPTSSYNQPSRNAGRLLNCFATASTAKGPVEIQGTPGVVTSRVFGGTGRGLAIQGGQLLALSGNNLYRVSDGSNIGTIPGSGTLLFAPGVSQLVTDNGYMYDGTTVGPLTDADRPDFSSVDWVDGFLVYSEANSSRWGCSALNDSSSFDGLDFASAEARPDRVVCLKTSQREVVVFGTDSTQVFWNSGEAGFTFSAQAGGFMELGILARLGVCVADNTLAMLAADRTFRILRGRQWVKISQIGVEEALSGYTTLADCEAYSYVWNGTVNICFRLPSEGVTWCFNVGTSEWYETDSDWVTAINHEGKVWIQHLDGTVGYLSDAVYSQFGESIIRSVTFPNVYDGNRRAFHSELEVVMRTGAVDAGIEPKLMLAISDDGGTRWTDLPPKSMGLTGKYSQIIRWSRLGSAKDRCYRISCSDPVPFVLSGAELEVVGGTQ